MNRFSLFILFFPLVLSAQDRTVDSLKLLLKSAKHDTTRVKILSELSEECEIEEILNYAEPCVKICESKLLPSLNKKQREFYLKCLVCAYNNIGFQASNNGENIKALNYYFRSLKIYKEIRDKYNFANTLNYIGNIYGSQGDIFKSLEYYHKSLKIEEHIENKSGIALLLNNIGATYALQNDFPKALEYYHNSLKIQEEIVDENGIANSLNNIAWINNLQGYRTKALGNHLRALKIREKIKDKKGIAITLNNIGIIYQDQGDFAMALKYFNKSLKISEEIKNKKEIAMSLNNISSTMIQSGLVDPPFQFAYRSLKIAKELGNPKSINEAARNLKTIYKKQHKFKEAFEMYELQIQMRDSVINTETKKASIKKQFQYEYEKKAAADSVKHSEEQKVKNALLTAQQAQLKQEKTQRLALYGGLVLVIAFLGFVFNRFRVTQKQKVIIEQQKVLVDDAYTHLEEKNKEVMDSIRYAKRIQTALLTSEKYIDRKLNELN